MTTRPIERLMIANRGEIAVRIARSAQELGLSVVLLRTEDEPEPAPRAGTESVSIAGTGPAAYLDLNQILAAAEDNDCDGLHPGYGFLSEDPRLAAGCAERNIRFLGPDASILELFADKSQARQHARSLGVPVLPGTEHGCDLDDALDFARQTAGPVVIKAVHGGGGRGMRVFDPEQLDFGEFDRMWRRCESEATSAFGSGSLYVERMLERARHVEVQVLGDGEHVVLFGDRDCTLQRRHQKIVEIAPAPRLPSGLRERLAEDALRLAQSVGYTSLGTFEFLIDSSSRATESWKHSPESGGGYAFIEANPRIQVEHTVTEEVFGVDLVQLQIAVAEGRSLQELGLLEPQRARGTAIQCRINAETFDRSGTLRPGGGRIDRFCPSTGPGVRTDTHLRAGQAPNLAFDSLIAKLIVHSHSEDWQAALRKARNAAGEFELAGCQSNLPFLRDLLAALTDDEANFEDEATTRWIDQHFAPAWGARQATRPAEPQAPEPEPEQGAARAGAQLQTDDPLAVLDHGKAEISPSISASEDRDLASDQPPEREEPGSLRAPMQGTVVSIEVKAGEAVSQGQVLVILEAMKMEHELRAPTAGVVYEIPCAEGDAVYAGGLLLRLQPDGDSKPSVDGDIAETVDLDHIRPDLQELLDRKAKLLDENRPRAVERRRKTNQRTVRENVEDLVDEGTWIEYGGLVVAAQRRRRELQDLIDNTPADGLVAGIGSVNGDQFTPERARCAVASYDYTVLAGTQGKQNHEKKDRLFDVARKWRLPLIFFTEGGGGRPGDSDVLGVAGLDCWAFQMFGELSGLVPLVGINSGRCFAGNAALLGCCDVVIATENSTIGMGGPAMIEGGGLGVFKPEEVGPMSVQVPNGVVDIAVADEAEAVAKAKQYLSYFQGPLSDWTAADSRHLRHAVPENRLRVYDTRRVIDLLCDQDSVLELRPRFGVGMITALARIEGQPIGIVANNPQHLAGAIDSPGADKAARFLQLCDAFDIPVLMLCDTPGIMVGPETEKTAIVRHCSRLFVVGASLSVPLMTIVLRKGYGLGAQAMAGGSFKAPLFTVAWPTGEFGGMGLEGAVKLGYRKELAAIEDPDERKAMFERMVAESYERGKAINTASHFELDDVIDPAESRHWISRALASVPPPPTRTGKKRPCIDTW